MTGFDKDSRLDWSHMVLALIVAVGLILLGFSILNNGLTLGERDVMDKIALVVVFAFGIIFLVVSICVQLTHNGAQTAHYLPLACLLFGLSALDYGALPGFSLVQSQGIAILLCGAGICGYVGGKRNSILLFIEIAVFFVSLLLNGLSNIVFLKASVVVLFGVGLFVGNLEKFDKAQIVFGFLLAVLIALTFWRSQNLFVWTGLFGAIFAWVSNRKFSKDAMSAPSKDKTSVLSEPDKVGKVERKPVVEMPKDVPAAVTEVKLEDDLPVSPQVMDWMQSFTNAASVLDMRGMRLYAYDAKNGKYYRFNQLSRSLSNCAGGLYPDLESLIEKTDKPAFMGFLNKAVKGSFDDCFHCRIWDDSKLEYADYCIKASVLDTEGPVIALYATLIESFIAKYRDEVSSLESSLDDSRRKYAEAVDESRRVFYSCNELVNSFIEKKSDESYSHIHAVCKITEELLYRARDLFPDIDYSDEMISRLTDATLLHDVGKIMVPDEVLKKSGSFTSEEYAEMKKHTTYGADIINKMPYVRGEEQTMKYALEIALHHHERVDGKGYPDGLVGDRIPFYVQIVSLADVYEALTARRVYKGPVSHEKAIEMIRNGECGTFSDRILECLDRSQADLARIRAEIAY